MAAGALSQRVAAGVPSQAAASRRSGAEGLRARKLRPPCRSSAAGRSSAVVVCKKQNAQSADPKKSKATTPPIVVIDNYDSFTYNICQYLGDLGCEFVVYRNDQVSVEDIRRMKPRGVLISPGPGCPEESGISLEAVEKLGPEFPLFGVCMGHQCIGQVFGGKIVRAPTGLMHGKTSPVFHTGAGVLEGLSSPFNAARYHSLVIENDTFPKEELELTAWTEDGTCMGVRHKRYPHIQGVQFHPESIITDEGKRIVANFVSSLSEER